MAINKYKLLMGAPHVQDEIIDGKKSLVDSKTLKNPDGTMQKVFKQGVYGVGDEFESDIDLVGRFGADKFELVQADPRHVNIWDARTETLEAFNARMKAKLANEEAEAKAPASVTTEGVMDSMTFAQLKTLAEEEEIDLKNAKTREDALRIIKAAMGQLAKSGK